MHKLAFGGKFWFPKKWNPESLSEMPTLNFLGKVLQLK